MGVFTKADAPRVPKLVIGAGTGRIKQYVMSSINGGRFACCLQLYCTIGLYQKLALGELQIRANLFQVPERHLRNASGTTFLIAIRAAFMNYPHWNNKLESSSLNRGQPRVDKRPLVLAVDDNQDNLELLTQILDLFGCECMGAVDGYAALSAAVDRVPDLIVLDICLPDIDGMEVVKRIQQNPAIRHIPIVAITALAKAEDRDRILQAGCVEYLSKPFNIKDLEIIIGPHLKCQAFLV
ncbi:response regulator [Microcoleus sp. LAD1_D5]|uniref:response regulator n=2 Tax=unclassified Microcoleus TaxID=2642155 RepID=UPI002FCEFF9D